MIGVLLGLAWALCVVLYAITHLKPWRPPRRQ